MPRRRRTTNTASDPVHETTALYHISYASPDTETVNVSRDISDSSLIFSENSLPFETSCYIYDPNLTEEASPLLRYLLALDILPRQYDTIAVSTVNPNHVFRQIQCRKLFSDSQSQGILEYPIDYLSNQQYIYEGPINEDAALFCMLHSIATSILNISHLGRGVPAGSQWEYPVVKLAQSPELMDDVLNKISYGELSLPESLHRQSNLPSWKKKALWMNGASSDNVKTLKSGMRERLRFSIPNWYIERDKSDKTQHSQMDNDFYVIHNKLIGIRELVYEYSQDIKLGDEMELPISIEIGENFADNCAQILDMTGAAAAIDLYLSGVPVEDILA